jgi:hypothetical protein
MPQWRLLTLLAMTAGALRPADLPPNPLACGRGEYMSTVIVVLAVFFGMCVVAVLIAAVCLFRLDTRGIDLAPGPLDEP